MGFSYHDNKLNFGISMPYLPVGKPNVYYTYVVQSFKVPSGQDPDNHIYDGYTTSGTNTLSFSVGRHGTSEVANWFNSNIAADQTTFGHTAGELNFAFIGALTMKVSYADFGVEEHYVMQDVALAQGHSGATDNWWFGGKACRNTGGNSVKCAGFEKTSGRQVHISFLRGDSERMSANTRVSTSNGLSNGVDAVGVALTDIFGLASWMRLLNPTTTLNNIMMPGSHDAGMSETNHCFPDLPETKVGSKTQIFSIADQFLNGMRYFDIRVDYDQGLLVTYHRTGPDGCNGATFDSVLNGAVKVLEGNPSEVITLKVSHIRAYKDHNPADIKQKINDRVNQLGDALYTNDSPNVNLGSISIKTVAGKIILVFDYDEYISPAAGKFRYVDVDGNGAGNFKCFDQYSDADKCDSMVRDQSEKWSSHGGLKQEFFFLLSYTLTPSAADIVFGTSVLGLAWTADSQLHDFLQAKIKNGIFPKPNIVYIDGVGNKGDFATSIVVYNVW